MICLLLAQQLFQGALKGSSVPRMLSQQDILMLVRLQMLQARMAMTRHLSVMLKRALLLPGAMMLSQLIFFCSTGRAPYSQHSMTRNWTELN